MFADEQQFKFYTVNEIWSWWFLKTAHLLNAELIIDQVNSFYAECQIFDHIESQERNEKIAI